MRVWAKFITPSSLAKAGLTPSGSETRPGTPCLRGLFKAAAEGGLQGRKLSGQDCPAWVRKAVPRHPHPQSAPGCRGKPELQFFAVPCKAAQSPQMNLPSPPPTSLFTSTHPHSIVPHGKRAFSTAAPILPLSKAIRSRQASPSHPSPPGCLPAFPASANSSQIDSTQKTCS